MKRHNRKARRVEDSTLSMTAMIDMVFLLLVFFIMVAEPRDVNAKLPASRPGTDTEPIDFPLVRIDISTDGYMMNQKRVNLGQMDQFLVKLARISKDQSILVTSTMDADHSHLIKVLDLCSKAELENISLMSR